MKKTINKIFTKLSKILNTKKNRILIDNDIPEPVNDIPEPVNDILEPVNDILEPVNDILEPVNDIPEPVNDINSNENNYLECPICLEKMENIYKTTCNHIFCSKCTNKMFQNESNICCPLCRTKLENNNVTKIIRHIYDIPENPDFTFINNEREKSMLINAYNTITNMDKWLYLRNYEPDPLLGFMLDQNDEINIIKYQINVDYNELHSGVSLALTMRNMYIIAKYGFTEYREAFLY
jgi:hypothetical protein